MDELTTLRAFASQILAMGGGYGFDTRLNKFYCRLCEAVMADDIFGEHKEGCLVAIVEEMPISPDGTRTDTE